MKIGEEIKEETCRCEMEMKRKTDQENKTRYIYDFVYVNMCNLPFFLQYSFHLVYNQL